MIYKGYEITASVIHYIQHQLFDDGNISPELVDENEPDLTTYGEVDMYYCKALDFMEASIEDIKEQIDQHLEQAP